MTILVLTYFVVAALAVFIGGLIDPDEEMGGEVIVALMWPIAAFVAVLYALSRAGHRVAEWARRTER